MSIELSNEFDKLDIDNVSDGDSNDDREREERDREINGMLSNAFDDLSSVSDEEDRTSDEAALDLYNTLPASPAGNQSLTGLKQPGLGAHSKLQALHTSTPLANYVNRSKSPLLLNGGDHHHASNESEIDELKRRLSSQEEEIAMSKNQVLNLNQELDHYKQEVSELSGVRTAYQETRSALDYYKDQYDSLKATVESQTQDNADLIIENKRLAAKIAQLTSSPPSNSNNSSSNQRCRELEEQLHAIDIDYETSKRDNRILAKKVASLKAEIEEIRAQHAEELKCMIPREKFKEMANAVKEQYKDELDEKLKHHLSSNLRQTQHSFEEDVKQRVLEARDAWNNDLSQQITRFDDWLRQYFDTTVPPPESELEALLLPLKRLWVAFLNSVRSATEDLHEKHQEVLHAKAQLDQALNDSRTERNETENYATESLRDEVRALRAEAEEKDEKLKRYKKKYYQEQQNHQVELDNIKREFAEVLKRYSPLESGRR